VSTETPSHSVSNFDHFVTQWMSFVTASDGSARSSSHVQLTGSAPPSIVNVHSSSRVCGVGPADSNRKVVGHVLAGREATAVVATAAAP
jgi:hypothetical protein